MNRIYLIGNLTADPFSRTTTTGKTVCNFTIAVNDRRTGEADFFRVATWEGIAENCQKYLKKGAKVAVNGSAKLEQYTNKKGENAASLLVRASEVEFLSRAEKTAETAENDAFTSEEGYEVVEGDELPF